MSLPVFVTYLGNMIAEKRVLFLPASLSLSDLLWTAISALTVDDQQGTLRKVVERKVEELCLRELGEQGLSEPYLR